MPARFLGFCCLLFGLAVLFLQPAFASEPRIALVIGNAEYGPAIGKLKNPANDAELMAATLKGLGFSVDLVLNADQKAMKRAVKSFGAKLREAGSEATGLFYYAGHGVQVEGENFLLPVGAEIEAEADVEIESIAAADVMTQMESAGNRVNLVFLDACRNNPLAKASRSGTRGLARLDAPRGSFVGYSTAPGDVAADGDGANSPYALALAEELKKPGISVEEAHRNVRARVLAQTGDKQTPWDSSSLTGAVILAEVVAPTPEPVAQSTPAPQPAATQQAAIDKEALFWDTIKSSNNPADFEAYLAQFPEGTFAPLAKNRIAALKSPQPSPQPAEAPTSPAGARQIIVSAPLEQEIADYLSKADDPSRWSALAMTADGTAVSAVFCNKDGMKVQACIDGIRNNPTTQAQTSKAALKQCGGPGECVLLYEGTSKNAGITLQTASLQGATQAPEPAGASEQSAESMTISADVQRQIDNYLANLTTGRFWALTIANDGSEVTILGCPKSSPASAGNQCRAYGSGYVDQAEVDRRALKACGGPSKCQLLYEGDRKVADLKLLAR